MVASEEDFGKDFSNEKIEAKDPHKNDVAAKI